MAEQEMQMTNVESVEATAPQPSTIETGENQQSTSIEPTAPASEQPEAATETPNTPPDAKSDVWNGNVEELPANMQERGKSMLRYMHKVTQEAAQVKQQAQAYNELINSPAFQEYVQRQQNPGQQQVQQLPVSEEDIRDAVLEADPKKLNDVLSRYVANTVNPIATQALNRIQQLEHRLTVSQHEREIDAFAQQHPDFYEIPQEIMRSAFSSIGPTGTIVDAYNKAKDIEKQLYLKATKTINKQVEEKKQAVTASPSTSVNPNVIYADNQAEANRIAYENAVLGKRVDVRVKPKKK